MQASRSKHVCGTLPFVNRTRYLIPTISQHLSTKTPSPSAALSTSFTHPQLSFASARLSMGSLFSREKDLETALEEYSEYTGFTVTHVREKSGFIVDSKCSYNNTILKLCVCSGWCIIPSK
jgi:hypothetical protein